MNSAIIRQNIITGRYEARYGSKLITSSTSLDYVIEKIVESPCKKALKYNVTGYTIDAGVQKSTPSNLVSDVIKNNPFELIDNNQDIEDKSEPEPKFDFGINQRFDFMSNLVQMVIQGTVPSVIITGDGGLGKTYTVMQELKNAGLSDTMEHDLPEVVEGEELVWSNPGDYTIIKGYATARGLYQTLYENKDKLVIFDDCDSILKDKTALNILKAALDSYDKRYISWMSSGFGKDSDIPTVFEFTGKVIFISNLKQTQLDQAIKSRSLRVDLSMTASQKIDRMEAIIENILPNYDMEYKVDALEFLRENCEICTDLNMRTFISVIKIRKSIPDWKDLALYTITA